MSTNLDVAPDETEQKKLNDNISTLRAYDNKLLKTHFEKEYAENKAKYASAKAIVDKYMTIMDKMEDIQHSENDDLIAAFGEEFYNDAATIEDIQKIVYKYHEQYEKPPVVPGPLATLMETTIPTTNNRPQSAGKKTSNKSKNLRNQKHLRNQNNPESQKNHENNIITCLLLFDDTTS